jgi:dTDP-glucose pyrophosphorylase
MKEQCLVACKTSGFYDVIKKLDENGDGVLPIIDSKGFFIGLVTDGDVRRAVLSNQLDMEHVINKHPYKLTIESTLDERVAYLKQIKRRHLPIVDKDNQLVQIFTLDDVNFCTMHNPVVIMAGGLGSRLGELTKDTPKPMLDIGDKPLLETILISFIEHGFHKFYISVNYKKDIIMEYFGNGSKWKIDIEYLVEDKKLGTAGALSLIKNKHTHPIVVANGDIMTNLDYEKLIKHHEKQKTKATMCVREYEYVIPYGVVKVKDYVITNLIEKPKKIFNINAGIYVIAPDIIESIPKDTFYDMTTLFKDIAKRKQRISAYFLKDYWIDVGNEGLLLKARDDIVPKY